jgi:phage replication O-like protein O
MSVDKPNYTQIPNTILGDVEKGNRVTAGLMTEIEGAELKVLLAACRLTFGYHQASRRASLSMMATLTGLSRQGVVNAAKSLENRGLISREQDGGVTLWQVVVKSFDQSDEEISKVVKSFDQSVNSVDHLVKSFDQTSQMIRPPSKKETRNKPKKETEKENVNLSFSCFEIWQQAQPLLAGLVTKATYEQVLKYCEARPGHNGTFTLAAPEQFCEQVQRAKKPILQALRQFTKADDLEVIAL